MLEPLKYILKTERIVLASSSPSRKDAFKLLDIPFETEPSNFDESKVDPKSFPTPAAFVESLSLSKATEVSDRLKKESNPPYLVIGADTVIVMDNEVIGKPKDSEHAKQILSRFSGREHEVYTGMSIIHRDSSKPIQFHEITKVEMGQLSSETIDAYVKTGEPMDKAGGYGIQKLGGSLIRGITGDYYNVVGFPLYAFCGRIAQLHEKYMKSVITD